MGKGFTIDRKIKREVGRIAECLLAPGEIDIEWDHIRDVLIRNRKTIIAFGSGTGKSRAIKACEDALGGYRSAAGTTMRPRRVVFRAVGPANLLLKEVNDAREMIQQSLCPGSEVVFGVARHHGLKAGVRITVLAA
jgi:cell division GTPase FtsZ